jgi:DNA-binding NarL/FixJ family response regulator
MNRLRVVVVDDHQLVLEAVRAALMDEKEIEIVGETTHGREAPAIAAREAADIVLLDLRMPDVDGLALIEELVGSGGRLKVVVLSGVDDPDAARQSLERGASAFVFKHIDPRDLAATLRQVAEGTVFSHNVGAPEDRRERAARGVGLTPREGEILTALGTGKANKQIAFDLGVTEQAVKYHLTNVYRKLGATNRVEALRLAGERGLLETRLRVTA